MTKKQRSKFAGPGRGNIITLAGEISAGRVPENWREHFLDLYRFGGCDKEAKAGLSEWRDRFSAELFDAWLEREEEFLEVIRLGRLYAEAFWRRKGRKSISDKDFNTAAYQLQMFNRYGWANSQKSSHIVDTGPTLASILREIGEESRGFPVK